MNYHNVVQDFAQRTRQNLEFVETHARQNPDATLFEVTQLINSLLGLLVFPQQRFYRSIPEIPLSQLSNEGWPSISTLVGTSSCNNLRDLMRYLRNAVAHFQIKFIADETTNQITGLELWNIRRNEENWRIQLTIEELRSITYLFLDLIEEGPDYLSIHNDDATR